MAYCHRCGSPLEEGAKFCHRCGTPVVSATPATPATPATAQWSGTKSQRSSSMNSIWIALVAIAAVAVVGSIAFAGVIPFLPGAVAGSGHPTTVQENVTDFSAVTISNGFRFTITHSNSYSVKVTIDDNLLNYVQVTHAGNLLSVALAPGRIYTMTSPKVEISMPDLNQLEISGGSTGGVNGFTKASSFKLLLSGGSAVSITGSAGELVLDCSGGSRSDLASFHVMNARVDVSGGSQATVNLDGRLDVTASGGSQLFYLGSPTLGNVDISGGSRVARK